MTRPHPAVVEQPAPTPSAGDVMAGLSTIVAASYNVDEAADLLDGIEARRLLGIERYGVPLQRGNGRDPDVDLLQELIDAAAYAVQGNRLILAVRLVEDAVRVLRDLRAREVGP